jgi:hypothetical protein
MGGACGRQGGTELHTALWLENMKKRVALGRPRRRWDNIKFILTGKDGRGWTGFIWLKIGASGGLLWTRWWTLEFHKMREIFWLAKELSDSQHWRRLMG